MNDEKLIITMQNKIKIMFEIYFSFLSTIFMKNVEKFDYFSLIDNKTSITRCEIMKTIHKINLNKVFKINKVINKALRQFTRVIIE